MIIYSMLYAADLNNKIMTREKFEKIFEETPAEWEGDNCYQGAVVIRNYTDNVFIGASHDTVWSADVDDLIKRGITEFHVTELAKLNWHIEEDALCCFV
jgi:hypothetical protein